jgi:hypothetical protein
MDHLAVLPLTDGHVHLRRVCEAESLAAKLEAVGVARAGIACQDQELTTNSNPAGFILKARHPERFFLLAGLEHAHHLHEADHALPLARQPSLLHALGADGIKLLASKPTRRRALGEPLDGPYFSEFFAECVRLDLPLLWHVADPEEFWEPEELPAWAKQQGWGYDSRFPAKEDLYRETENVLHRHSCLRVVLPHFYFLSADLPRAEALLTRYPNIHLDLAPGIELYYNLSRDIKISREFFIRFSDRILFGTDILSTHSLQEVRHRAGIVSRFLTEGNSFRVPEGADFLLGPPSGGEIRGLGLPQEALDMIMAGNFQRLFGDSPRALNVPRVREECLRLAAVEAAVRDCSIELTEGFLGAGLLSGTGF